MRLIGVLDVMPYFFVGGLAWVCMLCSGVHATITGVVLGLMTPSRPLFDINRYSQSLDQLQSRFRKALERGDQQEAGYALGQIETLTAGTESVLDRLLRLVHPWSAFVVLPIFALANAGVVLNADNLVMALRSTVMWGVLLGLLFGKPLGTTGLAWIASKLGLVSLPRGLSWSQIFGIGILGGVGFTVALFITNLAYTGSQMLDAAKIGILFASGLSGILGLLFLRLTLPAPSAQTEPAEQPASSVAESG